MEFCRRNMVVSVPTTEKQLCRFVAYLREEGLRYQKVKFHLSAVRHMQISNNMGDPKIRSMSQLDRTSGEGDEKGEAGQPTRTKLLITPEILRCIHQHWKERWVEWDITMLWAAMTLCSYGSLWIGKVSGAF